MPHELGVQLDRLADRLRGMPLSRLLGPYDPEPSRVRAATDLAQRLADAAAALESSDPVWRTVPDVGPAAVGDLVAVTGSDVLTALAGTDPAGSRVRLRDGSTTSRDELAAALTAQVRELRLRL